MGEADGGTKGPEETVAVRLTNGILMGSTWLQAGEVVDVTPAKALEMFEARAAVYADPSLKTPTPDEIELQRSIEGGWVHKDDPRLLRKRLGL